MKETGIFIAALLLFLFGLIIVFSFLARTWALFSVQAEEYWMTGSCKNTVYLLSQSGESSVNKEGFLYFNYNASSLADIPMRKVLLVDKMGAVKMALDDIKLIPNITMLLVAIVFLVSGLYLSTLLLGITGESFYENIQLILNHEHWAWLRYLSVSIIALLIILLSINMYFAVTLKNDTGDSRRIVSHASVKNGDTLAGVVVDKYTEEVFMERFNKIVHKPKVCVKITALYDFPIILDVAIDEPAALKVDNLEIGSTINVDVNSDLIAVWNGAN